MKNTNFALIGTTVGIWGVIIMVLGVLFEPLFYVGIGGILVWAMCWSLQLISDEL